MKVHHIVNKPNLFIYWNKMLYKQWIPKYWYDLYLGFHHFAFYFGYYTFVIWIRFSNPSK